LEQKTFSKILSELNSSPQKAKESLNDKRLTMTEKKIIEAHLFIRDNENEKAFNHINEIPPSVMPFVEGQRLLVSGVALNNMSHFLEAESYLQNAIREMKKAHSDPFLFIVYFNLFLIANNLGDHKKMKKTLTELEGIPIESKHSEIRLLRCQFLYSSEINDETQAKRFLSEIKNRTHEMSESDLISQLICEFSYHIKNEDLKECESVLKEMKQYRKFNLSENFNFMKKLLYHLKDNSPVYAYDKDFQDVPVLYHQLKVIQSLEALDFQAAEKHWHHLRTNQPQVYHQNFQFKGNKCLFSLCLSKHDIKKEPTVLKSESDENSKQNLLIKIFHESSSPIPKGYLFELLWGNPPADKEEMKKLTRLISKIRSKDGLDIQTRKGTYFIIKRNKDIKTG
jgi:hypothetical protein